MKRDRSTTLRLALRVRGGGGTWPGVAAPEWLERRTLLAVSPTVVGSDLVIAVDSSARLDTAYVRQAAGLIEVAGNPRFESAFSVSDATVSRVIVTGTAGSQRLVVAAGDIGASLLVEAVERVEFGAAAAFAGDVEMRLPAATLTATNIVSTGGRITLAASRLELAGTWRAATDVRIEGPTTLTADVSIAGAAGAVTFTGPVDGSRPGRQSLSVTSPVATTFDGPVGGRVPLRSLATRAVDPLVVPQSAASRSIPLHYLPYTTSGGTVQDKYGIEVSIGGGPVRMYEFDTGGTGFMAGYDPAVWPGIDPSGPPVDANYTSGNFYDAVAVDAVVTLGRGAAAVSTAVPVQIGAILSGGNVNTGASFDFLGTVPPVEGSFFGDFGASFGINRGTEPGVAVTNVLLQLPGNLSSGFVVELGPIGRPARLTVGLTPELRAQFPYAVTLDRIDDVFYPTSGRQVFDQLAFASTYTLSMGDRSRTLGPLQTLIDSGAPSMSVRLPEWPADEPYPFSSGGDAVDPGTRLTVDFPPAPGTPPLAWSFIAGNDGSVNQIGYSSSSGKATPDNNVNTGLNLYDMFDVMFDVEAGLLRLRPNGGSATVVLGSVTTLGPQSYGQNAVLGGTYRTNGRAFTVAGATTLAADTLVRAAAGAVTFTGAIDGTTPGGEGLSVRSGAATRFVRPIGPTVPLAGVTTDAAGSTAVAGAATTHDQVYADRAVLAGTFVSRHGRFRVGGPARLASQTWVNTDGAPVSFAGLLDGAFPLSIFSGDGAERPAGAIRFGGAIGRRTPLAGLAFASPAEVTARATVTLDGSASTAATTGIAVADGAVLTMRGGGAVRNFVGSGVSFSGRSRGSSLTGFTISGNVGSGVSLAGGDFTGTVLARNTIVANATFGIELAGSARGLSLTRNTIGRRGRANPWGFVSGGPNTHGIVVAPGDFSGTVIEDNQVVGNARAGLMAPGGVTGLLVRRNRLADNGFYGIELVTGDFTGTAFVANSIVRNGLTDVSLGAGALPPAPGGNPLDGYAADTGRYIVPYTQPVDFIGADSADPRVAMRIGTRRVEVNLDTGSRGLYLDALQLDPDIVLDGPRGYVYLNSSNRLFYGTWSTQRVTFVDSTFTPPGTSTPVARPAVATVPVLVVSAVGASSVPPPGSTTASTTFGTMFATGSVTITDGSRRMAAPIIPLPTPSPNGPQGTVTIPGGWWASYADNRRDGASILSPVSNFGVGFDRSGLGTFPTTAALNQSYNAFLNIDEMRDGSMRAGYVITPHGVTLGLDAAQSGFAYTQLDPTGLAPGATSPPDWQPAMGTLTFDGTPAATGPIVIDMGIPFSILTLPGRSQGQSFKGRLGVQFLNSGGRVSYVVDTLPGTTTLDPANLLNPSSVESFSPLPGAYSQNTPPASGQFFNTGRTLFAAFAYLYDATGGSLGLKAIDEGVLDSASGAFSAEFFVNPTLPTGVTNVTIR